MFLLATGGFADEDRRISGEGAATSLGWSPQGLRTARASLNTERRARPNLADEVLFCGGPAARLPVLEPTPTPERPQATVVRHKRIMLLGGIISESEPVPVERRAEVPLVRAEVLMRDDSLEAAEKGNVLLHQAVGGRYFLGNIEAPA